MSKDLLNNVDCEPCQGGIDAMDDQMIASYMSSIHEAWQYHKDKQCIERSFKFKNFSKTMFFVNALGHLADQQGHHPDVKFGYNYGRVRFTTHEAGGLTINDFICAKKVDLLNK
ncbi:MAG: 4a-hydroxytetrahydrobiopterin dehydratase [Marinicella sp.]